MGEETIQIYARVRPTPTPSPLFKCFATSDENRLQFKRVKDDSIEGYINNTRETYDFQFNGGVFDMSTRQEEIFDVVAKKAVLNALDGYNSTIFAYGQTGSGKTFTITGGPEKYADRGMIPRTISFIFDHVRKHPERTFSIHVSYLEIYNSQGYDLLLETASSQPNVEDLPKVALLEDMEGNIHIRNLSGHIATSEEDALNLLFLGDTNRMISETPMNLVSSRSHCIFTINLESAETGTDMVRRSKLHLVDLAGSERVYKTNVGGQTLAEAKYINTSLHYLEQVILALSTNSGSKGGSGATKVHVPYRNSILTTVLRDSLGGNSKTVMIATINPEQDHVDESISTCRFAMRVASIQQNAQVNEEVDPKLLVRKLRKEISELKEEIHFLKSTGGGDAEEDTVMLEADRRRCADMVKDYVNDPADDAQLVVGKFSWVKECFRMLKQQVQGLTQQQQMQPKPKSAPSSFTSGTAAVGSPGPGPGSPGSQPLPAAQQLLLEDQLKKLQLQIQQRDNEILILVSMLKKKSASGGGSASLCDVGTNTGLDGGAVNGSLPSAYQQPPSQPPPQQQQRPPQAPAPAPTAPAAGAGSGGKQFVPTATLVDSELLADRNRYFEMFRKSYRKNEAMEENKQLLRQKYEEAQQIGKQVNESRNRINHMKAMIEQLRVEHAMQGASTDPATGGAAPSSFASEEEKRLLMEMEEEKLRYKNMFNGLRELKTEIEGIQHLLEKSKVQIQKDFEQWYLVMLQQQQQQQQQQQGQGPGATGSWQSPGAGVAGMGTSAAGGSSSGGNSAGSRKRSHSITASSSNSNSNSSSSSSNSNSNSSTNSGYSKNPAQWSGNAEADADIQAFYKARDSLLQQQQQRH